jgi:hypothetical protein
VERGRHRAGQRLIKMMMRVDQSGQHHVRAGIEGLDRRRARFTSGRHQFDHAAVLHHDAAFGAVRSVRSHAANHFQNSVNISNIPTRAAVSTYGRQVNSPTAR